MEMLGSCRLPNVQEAATGHREGRGHLRTLQSGAVKQTAKQCLVVDRRMEPFRVRPHRQLLPRPHAVAARRLEWIPESFDHACVRSAGRQPPIKRIKLMYGRRARAANPLMLVLEVATTGRC